MKTTGTTNEGNYIVEMTSHEHLALSMLADVTEGKELDYLHFHKADGIKLDMTTVLGAIVNFVTIKELLNKLQHELNDIDNTLMNKRSEADKMMDFFKGDNDS